MCCSFFLRDCSVKGDKIRMKYVYCRQMSEEDAEKTDKEEQKSNSANADTSVKKPAA